jgi:hypothetical protein
MKIFRLYVFYVPMRIYNLDFRWPSLSMAHIFSLALCTFFAMQLFIGIILLFDLVMLVLIRRCLSCPSSTDKCSYHVHVRTFFLKMTKDSLFCRKLEGLVRSGA